MRFLFFSSHTLLRPFFLSTVELLIFCCALIRIASESIASLFSHLFSPYSDSIQSFHLTKLAFFFSPPTSPPLKFFISPKFHRRDFSNNQVRYRYSFTHSGLKKVSTRGVHSCRNLTASSVGMLETISDILWSLSSRYCPLVSALALVLVSSSLCFLVLLSSRLLVPLASSSLCPYLLVSYLSSSPILALLYINFVSLRPLFASTPSFSLASYCARYGGAKTMGGLSGGVDGWFGVMGTGM